VLVTGIQPPRVREAKRVFQPKDLGWLDSCDKHRNEGNLGFHGLKSFKSGGRPKKAGDAP
jgi:hypothetical protein